MISFTCLANRTTAATTIVAPLPTEDVASTSTQNFTTTTPIQVCGSNWTYFDYAAQCYILIVAKEDFSWHEAEEYCVELGGHLASIHDEVENVFLGEWTRTGLIYREKDCNYALSSAIQHYPFTGLLYFNDTEINNFRWSDHSTTDYYSKKIFANDDKELASCLTIAGDNKYWDDGQIVTLEKLPPYAWVFVRCVESKRKRFVCQKPVSDEVKNCEKTETT
uniref:C-type lectin domain-containing protein n=1 Tax=Acrobeloides nanus TaxID=290746 RepID=A0A914DCZ6_9BILA